MAKNAQKTVALDNWLDDMNTLTDSIGHIIGVGIYAGAGVMADGLKEKINALPVRTTSYIPEGQKLKGATQHQKIALKEHMGISSMESTGDGYDILIGFDGYDDEKTEKYPKGHAVSMIARSIESGTSFLTPYPFIRTTYRQYAKKSKESMEAAMTKQITKYLKNTD